MNEHKTNTLADYTEEEIAEFKAKNGWFLNQITNNGYDLYTEGSIKDRNNNHKVIGIETDSLKHVVKACQSNKFAYARIRDYGVTIYHYDSTSPTGVISASGCDKEFMWLIDSLTKGSTLSPTEDLRTAH